MTEPSSALSLLRRLYVWQWDGLSIRYKKEKKKTAHRSVAWGEGRLKPNTERLTHCIYLDHLDQRERNKPLDEKRRVFLFVQPGQTKECIASLHCGMASQISSGTTWSTWILFFESVVGQSRACRSLTTSQNSVDVCSIWIFLKNHLKYLRFTFQISCF